MKLSTNDAVTKMAHYVNYLAATVNGGRAALHVKQAKVNRLIKLSAAIGQKHNIVEALKVAYPEMNDTQRFKTASALIRGLAAKMRKAAAIQKRSMGAPAPQGGGMMGAAGGQAMAGGGGGMQGPAAGGMSTMAGTTGGMPTGGAGIQTAPSYSAMGAPAQIGMKA